MLRLLIILTIGFPTFAFGQNLSGQVFMLTEQYLDDKCEVFAECDCCSTDLFFLTDKEFGMVSRCLYNDSYFKGMYSIQSNGLRLTFKQKVVNKTIDEETNEIKNEMTATEIKPFRFAISLCDNKVRIQHETIKEFKNGSRYSLTREKELIDKLGQTEAWKLISQ